MDPMTAYALIMGGSGLIGSLAGGSGGPGSGQASSRSGRPEWWAMQPWLNNMRDQQVGFGQQLTPQYMSAIQNALSGNMGLSPQVIQMMMGRANQQLTPEFAQQQDTLRSSFNPRMAGSGAMGQAMANLLGQQSQTRTGAMTDINIQDLLARFGMMGQGLGQMGSMWGSNLAAQEAYGNQTLRWLGL